MAIGAVGGSRAAAWVRRNHAVAALAIYAVAAVLVERSAVAHLGSVCACNGGSDPTQFMWSLVWWPHAIVHGSNPFITHAIWAPAGLDLATVTSVPAAALIASPATALLGPVVSYNLLTILAPVIGGWFAYRLCLYVSQSPGASILGGYLFGFSSYELAHMIGLLHMQFTFAIPAAVLLTLRRLDDAISARRYAALVALVLIVQLGLATEMLLTMTGMGAVALLAGWIFATETQRRRVVGLLVPLAAAYGVTALVCSPYLYYELIRGHGYAQGRASLYPGDLLGFAVPSQITQVAGGLFSFTNGDANSNLTENGVYLGLPTLAIVVAYAISGWRTRTARVLLAVAAVALVWTLGTRLYVAGHRTIPLPFALLAHLPLFDQMLPVRVAVYVALACAVMAALWLSKPTRWRWALAAAAAVALIPNADAVYPHTKLRLFHARLREPRLFTTTAYRNYIAPADVILPLPWGKKGLSLLWQAQARIYFRMASGYFRSPVGSYAREALVPQLLANAPGPRAQLQLRSFIVRYRVREVIADAAGAAPWLPILARLGLRAVNAGELLVYRVPSTFAV